MGTAGESGMVSVFVRRWMSQNLRVSSDAALTIVRPSFRNSAPATEFEWPARVNSSSPRVRCHRWRHSQPRKSISGSEA